MFLFSQHDFQKNQKKKNDIIILVHLVDAQTILLREINFWYKNTTQNQNNKDTIIIIIIVTISIRSTK